MGINLIRQRCLDIMKQVVGIRKTHKKITGKLFNKISDKVKSLFANYCVA